jgi:drug/metabolite transporter (DMT)-like permease
MDDAATPAGAHVLDRSRQALWAALGLIVLWGANFSVQKAVFEALSPGGFLFVRYLMMPLAAALLLCLRHGARWPRLARADAFALLRLGLVGHLLHVGLVTYGIHWSTAFSSSIILACGPVFTLLILHWHGDEALTRG